MISINGEEAASSPDARRVAMDTKLMVATDHGKGLSYGDGCGDGEEEDAMAIAVVTGTSKKPSKDQSINPLLLASARTGSCGMLAVFIEREDSKVPPMMIYTPEFHEVIERGIRAEGRVAVSATRDVEEGVDNLQPASLLAAGVLLKGVTPGGDTALHVVASNGDGKNFLKYAGIIYARDRGLLFAKNHRGDTPLHCAAQAGNFEMASHLIDLARREGAGRKLKLLRIENNRHETALHKAVRTEDGGTLDRNKRALLDADPVGAGKEKNKRGENEIGALLNQDGNKSPGHEKDSAEAPREAKTIIKLLMAADRELANFPSVGISPLCLAILLDKSTIALTLYDMSGGNLSYSGPDGQNALHVALQRKDTGIVEFLLHWNKSLTVQVDKDGSTPLHFVWFSQKSTRRLVTVYNANPAALYQADNKGFYPIHVAASLGATNAIDFFLHTRPDSAGLLDAKGRTFLHVATEKGQLGVVSYACRNASLAWILNIQDNDGNTALHLAIQARSLKMFCALLGNLEVNLNITNNQGETPRDLSTSMVPRGVGYAENFEKKICSTLGYVQASYGTLRLDKIAEKYGGRLKPGEEVKESERLKDATQTLVIASVLIASMAFSATFALPGGYRADDHTNGGTPTLAGRYLFDAFIMATALALICSLLATAGFMFAGIPMVNLITRKIYFLKAVIFMSSSVTCLSIAFALGVYMVLAPVARNTAVAVCVITPAILLIKDLGFLLNIVTLARPLCIRKGLYVGMLQLLRRIIIKMVAALWPFVVTFGWAALASIHHRR